MWSLLFALLDRSTVAAFVAFFFALFVIERRTLKTLSVPTDMSIPPIERLPPELLAAIFEALLPDPSAANLLSYYNASKNLALVSSWWRQTILSTPTLWRLLSTEPHVPRTSTILARSGQHLSLYVYGPMSLLSEDTTVLQSVPRWQHAVVFLTERESTSPHRLSRQAPRLRSLCLIKTATDDSSALQGTTVADLFDGNAPSLQTLSLMRVSLPWTSRLFSDLRILHLFHICHNPPGVLDVLYIVQQCPALISLRLIDVDLPDFTIAQVPDSDSVTLENLNHLHLQLRRYNALNALLLSIATPICLDLKIGGCAEITGEEVGWGIVIKAFNTLAVAAILYKSLNMQCSRGTLCCSTDDNECKIGADPMQLDANGEGILRRMTSLAPKFHEASASINIRFTTMDVPEQCLTIIPNITSITLDCVSNLAAVMKHLAQEEDGFPASKLQDIIIIAQRGRPKRENYALLDTIKLLHARREVCVTIKGDFPAQGPFVPPSLFRKTQKLVEANRLIWVSYDPSG